GWIDLDATAEHAGRPDDLVHWERRLVRALDELGIEPYVDPERTTEVPRVHEYVRGHHVHESSGGHLAAVRNVDHLVQRAGARQPAERGIASGRPAGRADRFAQAL